MSVVAISVGCAAFKAAPSSETPGEVDASLDASSVIDADGASPLSDAAETGADAGSCGRTRFHSSFSTANTQDGWDAPYTNGHAGNVMFTSESGAGMNGDGALFIKFPSDGTYARERIVEHNFEANSAPCFDLHIRVRYTAASTSVSFADVAFANQNILELSASDAQLYVGQQNRKIDFSYAELGHSNDFTLNTWHDVLLSYRTTTGTLSAMLDGKSLTITTPTLEFDIPKVLELGLVYAEPNASGTFEIDDVTLD